MNVRRLFFRAIIAIAISVGVILSSSLSHAAPASEDDSIAAAPPGYVVFDRLPWNTSQQSSVRVSRTGLLYKSVYDSAGLTEYTSSDYHGANTKLGLTAAQRGAIDFMLPKDTPVHAVAGGTIHRLNSCEVAIRHANGMIAYYLHMSKVEPLADPISAGQLLGLSGDSCGAEGEHLHFSLLNGTTEVPVAFSNVPAQTNNGKTCPATVICPSKEGYVEFRYGTNSGPTQIRVKANIPGRSSSPISVWVYNSSKQLVNEANITVNTGQESANINLGTTLPPADYSVVIRASHTLTKAKKVSLGAGVNPTIDFGDLLGGDYNSDDKTNLIDFQAFARNYLQGPKPTLNLFGDSWLRLEDFLRFAQNYLKTGDALNLGLRPGGQSLAQADNADSNTVSAQNSSLSLFMSPMLAQYSAGQEFDVEVSLSGTSSLSDGGDISLLYDSCALQYVSFTKGDVFSEDRGVSNNPEIGILDIGVSENVTAEGTTRQGTVGTIRFRAQYGSTQALLRILYSPGVTIDSNIVDTDTGADILTFGGEALYTLVGGTARPGVSGIVRPIGGSYLNQPIVPLSVTVDDGCGRSLADSVKFEAYYNGSWKLLGFDRDGSDGWSYDWNASDISDQVVSIRAQIYGLDGSYNVFEESNLVLDRQPSSTPVVSLPSEIAPDSSIRVAWNSTDNLSGISTFNLEYKQGEEGSWNEITDITETSYTISNIASGHDYYFRVLAIDKAGNSSEYSQLLKASGRYEPDNSSNQAKTITNGETQVRSLYAAGDVDWVKFSLTQTSAVALETSGEAGNTVLHLYNNALTQIDFDDNSGVDNFSLIERECGVDALPAGTYYLKVTEFSNSQLPHYELTYSVSEVCQLPPSAPSNLTAAAQSTSAIQLNWQDNAADETAFHIGRSPNGTSGWTEIGTVGANQTSYQNTNLACATTYYYRVRAFRSSDGQFSNYSNVANATTQSCPTAGSTVYVSATTNGSVDGIGYAHADITANRLTGDTWQMFFDASNVGLTQNLSSFGKLPDGSLLLNFKKNQTIAGVGTFTPWDIARFVPASPGNYAAGTFSWYLDGSDVLLSTAAEKIDAIAITANGRLIISTTGTAVVKTASGATFKPRDEDLFVFSGTTGSASAGSWAMYFDGSLVAGLAVEDINGAWVDPANGDIYLTLFDNFTVGGVSGTAKDIIRVRKLAGTAYEVVLYWSGPAHGFSGTIDGIEIDN